MFSVRRSALALTSLVALGAPALAVAPAVAAPTTPAAPASIGVEVTPMAVDAVSNREWHLRLPGVSPAVYDLGRLTIARNGTVTGSDGCNTFTGKAHVAAPGGWVRFSDVTWTQRACRFAGETGNAYVAANKAMGELLDGVAQYTAGIRDNSLTLTSGAGTTTRWVTTMPISTSTVDTVSRKAWHLALDGIAPEQSNTAWFRIEDGQLTGSDGCNRIFAPATVDARKGTLTIGEMGSTRMLCFHDDEQAELDAQAVHEAITSLSGTTVTWVNTGSRLLLTTPDGQRLTFVR